MSHCCKIAGFPFPFSICGICDLIRASKDFIYFVIVSVWIFLFTTNSGIAEFRSIQHHLNKIHVWIYQYSMEVEKTLLKCARAVMKFWVQWILCVRQPNVTNLITWFVTIPLYRKIFKSFLEGSYYIFLWTVNTIFIMFFFNNNSDLE